MIIPERINCILKQEYGTDKYDIDIKKLKLIWLKNSIKIHNQLKPHQSNYILTPNQMHNQNLLKLKASKKKKGSDIKSLPLVYQLCNAI